MLLSPDPLSSREPIYRHPGAAVQLLACAQASKEGCIEHGQFKDIQDYPQ